MDNVSDPRYVKRIDFSDGVARSLAELTQRLQGASSEEIQIYWEKCPSLYPQDLGRVGEWDDGTSAEMIMDKCCPPQSSSDG